MCFIDYKPLNIRTEVSKRDLSKPPHIHSLLELYSVFTESWGMRVDLKTLFILLQLFSCARDNYFTRSLQLRSRLTKHAGRALTARQAILT